MTQALRDRASDVHIEPGERDVTVADVRRALDTGMRSVEHVKRFTTIGTGSDQGKTAGINETAIVATQLGQPVGAVGVTTFRPPYVPVSFGLMAGRNRGDLFDPIRMTAMHPWHVAHGAVFENVGQWKRPRFYPRGGEDMDAAVARECRAARERVAALDASTLGKIDIRGPDAASHSGRGCAPMASWPDMRYRLPENLTGAPESSRRATSMVTPSGVTRSHAPQESRQPSRGMPRSFAAVMPRNSAVSGSNFAAASARTSMVSGTVEAT